MITARTLGERLSAARKARDLTQSQVAAGLGVARSTLVAMEKGERRPSSSQLRQWSEVLGVTLHELVRPWTVRSDAAPGFRLPRIPGVEPEALERAVATLRSLAGRFAELEKRLEIHRPPAPLETLDTYRAQDAPELEPRLAAESAAAAVRGALGLGEGPVVALAELLEVAAGFRIFQLVELPGEIAAVLLWGEELGGAVALQPRLSEEERRWALLHELGHFLRDPEAGDVLPRGGHARRDASEVFAEHFATSVLLPATSVTRQFMNRRRANGGTFSVADVLWLAALNGVTPSAMLVRLEELSLLARGTRKRVILHRVNLEEPRMPTRDQFAERWPSRYVTLALDAYARELITERELADYLETDRVSARTLYRERRLRDLGEGPVELDLAEGVLIRG